MYLSVLACIVPVLSPRSATLPTKIWCNSIQIASRVGADVKTGTMIFSDRVKVAEVLGCRPSSSVRIIG